MRRYESTDIPEFCPKCGSTMVLINQARMKSKAFGYQMKFVSGPSGGNASEHFPDVRIWMYEGQKLKKRPDQYSMNWHLFL